MDDPTQVVAAAIHTARPHIDPADCTDIADQLLGVLDRTAAEGWGFSRISLSATKRRANHPFGGQLRALREQAGLRQADVCKKARWSVPKLSRIETGQRGVSYVDLEFLLRLYRVTDRRLRTQLLKHARQADRSAPPNSQ